jgi:inorganic triphosphatase YgiF
MYEQELKLTAPDAQTLSSVLNSDVVQQYSLGVASDSQRYLANYYDTRDRVLEKDRCSLRARLEGKKYRAAFKLPGKIVDGLSQRQEYECEISGWFNKPGMLPDGELKSLVLNHVEEGEKLFTMVSVDMQRRILELELNGTKIELVTDDGVVNANDRQVRLFEIELELLDGDINDIKYLGDILEQKFELSRSLSTKHQIGLELWKNP